jgi:DNA-binding NarL/FixJ family response regulator
MFIKSAVMNEEFVNFDAEESIDVIIGDTREAMREGLRQMLNSDENINVVGEARNGKELLSQIKTLSPDIVILDGKMKGVDDAQIINSIKAITKDIDVIVLNDERSLLIPSIENGVAGFLTRDISRNELVTAIRIIHLWRLVLFKSGTHFTLVKL